MKMCEKYHNTKRHLHHKNERSNERANTHNTSTTKNYRIRISILYNSAHFHRDAEGRMSSRDTTDDERERERDAKATTGSSYQ